MRYAERQNGFLIRGAPSVWRSSYVANTAATTNVSVNVRIYITSDIIAGTIEVYRLRRCLALPRRSGRISCQRTRDAPDNRCSSPPDVSHGVHRLLDRLNDWERRVPLHEREPGRDPPRQRAPKTTALMSASTIGCSFWRAAQPAARFSLQINGGSKENRPEPRSDRTAGARLCGFFNLRRHRAASYDRFSRSSVYMMASFVVVGHAVTVGTGPGTLT